MSGIATAQTDTMYIMKAGVVINKYNVSNQVDSVIFYKPTVTAAPIGTVTYGSTTDQNGNTVKTVTIGTQTWFAENLKVTTYNDGTTIPNVTDATTWVNDTTGAQCSYNNADSNVATYGRLYNWYALNTAKLCPTGWHLPSDDEWAILSTTLGGDITSGGALKETGTTHWLSPNTGATNTSGFSALPSGYRDEDGTFSGLGSYSGWWSPTKAITGYANNRNLYDNYSYFYYNLHVSGFSVRCLRN